MGIFSDSEMERRHRVIAEGMTRLGIDAAVICSPDNVYYCTGIPLLSGWGRPMWCVVTPGEKPRVVGAAIEQENMEDYGWTSQIRVFKDEAVTTDSGWGEVVDMLPKRMSGGMTLGIEQRSIPYDVYRRLSDVGRVALADVGGVLSEARLLKSEEEIALLRLGGAVGKIGAGAFVDAVSPGVPELVVAAHAVNEMDRALAALAPSAATSTYSYCQFGSHSLTPHLHPTTKRARRGDIVALNVFPVIWGYCVELERTLVLGEPSVEQRRLLAIATEAFDVAKAAVKPGVEARDVHRAAENVFTAHGVSDLTRHGTGHAHGIMIGSEGREEGGELREYNCQVLQPGMVSSVEPGLFSRTAGAYRHSDVMLVRNDGAECLTEFPTGIEL